MKNDKLVVVNPSTGTASNVPGQDIGSNEGFLADGLGGVLDGLGRVLDAGVGAYSDIMGARTEKELRDLKFERDLLEAQSIDLIGAGAGNGVPQGNGSGSLPGLNNVFRAGVGGGGGSLFMLAGLGVLAAFALSRK